MASLAAVEIAAAGVATAAGRLHVLLHILQQEHYETARLRTWLKGHGETSQGSVLAVVALSVIAAAASWATTVAALLVGIVAVGVGVAALASTLRREQIKPLVFTRRATRLYVCALLICATPPLITALAVNGPAAVAGAAALAIAARAASAGVLSAAVILTRPIDRASTRRFVHRAQRKLADVQPLVVGITGSYGKTTTKACVAEVLELLGPSYPTPRSFNSYLGIVRAINEGLLPNHRSFIAEMGAYRRGDIAELCKLVSPTAAVLTAIGPAHLERFGSIDEIEAAKGELADSLPADGLFVTRADDERCVRIARTRARSRTVLFALANTPNAQVWAEELRIETGRTSFALCVRTGSATYRARVRAKLLGEHNVANLLAAAAVGVGLGLEADAVARALSRVVPPPHRLSPIVNSATNVVVIDDSYNANPEGAAAALAILRAHPASRRVLVTPGMVELGEFEEEENIRLGELAAAACDRAVLIGNRRAGSIRAGLVRAGFPESQIVMAPDSKTAHTVVGTTTLPGDVILFENDLPDVYAG